MRRCLVFGSCRLSAERMSDCVIEHGEARERAERGTGNPWASFWCSRNASCMPPKSSTYLRYLTFIGYGSLLQPVLKTLGPAPRVRPPQAFCFCHGLPRPPASLLGGFGTLPSSCPSDLSLSPPSPPTATGPIPSVPTGSAPTLIAPGHTALSCTIARFGW